MGGDELFAGYPHYQRVLKALPWLRTFPRLGISAAAWGAAHLNPRYAKLEALTLPGAPIARLYYAARGLFMPSEIRALVHPDLLAQTALGHAEASSVLPTALAYLTSSLSPLHGVMALELRRYMHNQLLRDSDVFGMAQSLEIRVPLIDHRIVEAVFRIDPRAILGSHDAVSTFAPPKALLMNALPTSLPQLCTHRPKMGFTFPFDRWMQDGWRARLERDVLQHDRGPRFLAKNAAIHVWESFNGRRVNWCRPWSLVALKKTLGQ